MLFAAGALLATPPAAVCGDKVVDPPEQCDDGNFETGDGCDACRLECTDDADCPGRPCTTAGLCSDCDTHCDCPQGHFCYRGLCQFDPDVPVYCCENLECPPGRRCFLTNGQKSFCEEDPGYFCDSACDCGPAHCCKDGMCVKDIDDPWIPGGHEVGPACEPAVDATYCCADALCHAGRVAWEGQEEPFLCWDTLVGQPIDFCQGDPCYYAGHCDPGESCVDTTTLDPPSGGAFCSLAGGSCVSNAQAESVYGISPASLLPACEGGCIAGQPCEVGWRPGGPFAAQRIVGVCGSCGNATCEPQYAESAVSCPLDCSCGDRVCDTTEVLTCPEDCGTCGDRVCAPHESPKTCPGDCDIVCRDDSCDASEAGICTEDCVCAASPSFLDLPIACGDGLCQHVGLIPENCVNCALDCDAVTDSDDDGTPDGCDLCPNDFFKVVPGACGCGILEIDVDDDGICDDVDPCLDPGGCPIFTDGFEAGDVAAWSLAVEG